MRPMESDESVGGGDQKKLWSQPPAPAHGGKLLGLMASTRHWVHRRVESFRLDADGQTRWHVSIDMTVPEDGVVASGKNQLVVPVAFMKKGTLRRLDVEYAGKSVPVLGRAMNSKYALAMLIAAMPPELNLDDYQHETALKALKRVVECSTADADSALEAFDEWYSRARRAAGSDTDFNRDHDLFSSFVRSLAQNFLFLVVLESEVKSRRILLKFAWDHEPPTVTDKGKVRVSFSHELADFGFAASQHVEVEVPRGLAVRSLEVAEFFPNDRTSPPVRDVPSHTRSVAHVAIAPTHRFARGGFRVEVEPAKAGIFAFTHVAVLAVAASVVVAQLIRIFDAYVLLDNVQRIPSPSASIILVAPALLVSWMSRRTEHRLLILLLKPLRKALLSCSIALLTMAALAAIPFRPEAWWLLWFVVIYFSGSAVRTYWNFTRKRIDVETKK